MSKIKIIITVICVAVTVAVACSCGKSGGEESSVSASAQKSAEEIFGELETALDNENLNGSALLGDSLFSSNAEKLYGISADELSDGGIFYNDGGGFADEISILKPADGDTSAAQKALEERQAAQIKVYTGYAPEEVSKIENAEIFTCNGWAVLVISDNPKADAEKIKEFL